MKVVFVHGLWSSTRLGGGTGWSNRSQRSAWAPRPWSCRAASARRSLAWGPWGTCTPTPTRCALRARRGERAYGARGHSYGGMVITDAASGQERVRHQVYVTSVMPERGETMASFGGSRGPGP
jgi:pimeloyl-ACP methyl ester carboxylesterase